jgi:hypothetical protein
MRARAVNSPVVGWALAAAAVVAGWFGYGWRGVVLALTVVVFWLLLQFSRTMRVLRNAAHRPVGYVDNAVMLNARVREGMRLTEVIALTRSLGRNVRDEPETFAWTDAGGDSVELEFRNGRCRRWQLQRAAPPGPT